MRGARRLGLALAAALALAASPAAAQRGHPAPYSEFGDWTSFCDTDGGCGIVNLSTTRTRAGEAAEAPWVCLWLGRAGVAEASLSVQIDPTAAIVDDAAPPRPLVLELDQGAARLELAPGPDGRLHAAGEAVPAFAARMRTAARASLREAEGGPVIAWIPVIGVRPAYDAAEERRRDGPRVPPSAAPIPRPMPEVSRLVPPGLRAVHGRDCLPVTFDDGPARAFALGERGHLWILPCARTAYNPTRLAVVEGRDRGLRPLLLNSIWDHDGLGPDLPNLAVSADGLLLSLAKSRGPGDCGYERVWAWTGGRFALAREHVMPRCFGAGRSQWLRLHEPPARTGAPPRRPPC